MFESLSSEEVHRAGRARYFGTLPISLLVHGIAFAAVPIIAAWRVNFPTQYPAMMVSYNLVEPPAPPPPPPPPPAPPKKVPMIELIKKVDLPPEFENLAPSIIPDEIPEVVEQMVEAGVEGGVEGGVAGGVVGGSIDEGILGGDVGGATGGVVGSVDDGRVVVPRDATLRMSPLSQVYPTYPERARMQRWEDQLVVRYVIGTDGRVKEVTILDPAHRKIFDDATLAAIKHWRFRPMIKDGEAKEVVHELTIYYRLSV